MEEYINIDTKQFRGAGFMTVCKYNNSGEIIYIADKDSKFISAISTDNYSVIGTFDNHGGVVWNLDVSSNDKVLISCSGDLTIYFWDTQTGNLLYKFTERCIPKYVCTQKKSQTNLVGIICEALTRKSPTYISIYDLDQINLPDFSEKIKLCWNKTSKPLVLLWLNESTLIIGCDDGKIVLRDLNDIDGSNDIEYLFHDGPIKSIVWDRSLTQILTGSSDCTSKHIDVKTWEIKCVYKSTVPINWACWNHNDRKVLIGGGIEAMNVAKTSNNDLNLKVFRTSDQKLTNHMKSHFGPIRYIDKSPVGKNFITASQDGTVKIYFIKDEVNGISNTNTNKSDPNKSDPNKSDPNKSDPNKSDPNKSDPNTSDTKEIKTFNKFGLNYNVFLIDEMNKLENLSWKPKFKLKETKKIKWVPGMQKQIDKDDSTDTYTLTEIDNRIGEINPNNRTSNSDLFQINSGTNGDEKQNSTIRVTNLPNYIQPRDLAELFDLYGRIVERDGIKIKKYNDTTMAFIKYVYLESAIKAIDNLDGSGFENYVIHVEFAKQNEFKFKLI